MCVAWYPRYPYVRKFILILTSGARGERPSSEVKKIICMNVELCIFCASKDHFEN